MLPELDTADRALHAAAVEQLEQRVMDLALERTGARHGAIFLWDAKRKGLAIDFHVVEGLVVTLPGALLEPRRDGKPNGIAMHVFEANASRLVNDTSRDPSYARYFLDVQSIAAVPIVYQRKPIGVLSVSAREAGAFTAAHVMELEALAASAAKFLRRAQLYRATRDQGRPFLIKGLSPQWLDVERRIERVAYTDAAVLITGESGTGKELVAHAIHFNSRRAAKPFVTVNCAAIPETMLESVLFGHVRGAFTGASFDKTGELQKADGGTLFLDELGELPMALQAKVLRALEYGEVQPLGSNKAPERVDVRLVCATNRDLPARVREGAFRDDLYYRVGVMTIELPALRTYKESLEVLAHVFREQACKRHDKQVVDVAPAAMERLLAYGFPGNVRELRNAIEHAVILADGEVIEAEHLPRSIAAPAAPPSLPRSPSVSPSAPKRPTLAAARESWLAPLEARYLRDVLDDRRGNVRGAARDAGIDAVTMYRLLKKRGVPFGRG
jgi:transcriptional regulator with GAF, ATPase, and Fis domain|nr:sigma-54-dependent Fis family transcriptional regulator [Kofleriaceae bacterium]